MGWEITPLIAYILASAFLSIGIGVWALRERPDPVATPLAMLMFVASAWAIPYAISLGYSDLDQVVRWQQLRYGGTVFTPVFYFVLTYRYAGYDLSWKAFAGISVVPVVTLVVVATHQYHDLFWESTAITTTYGVSAFAPDIGPWHVVHLLYSYLLMLAGLGILAGKFIWSTPVYRKQAGVIFLCGFVPFLANVVANVGLGIDETIDLTALTLAFTGLSFALAFFYLDLLQLEPVARDHFVEELDDGVVVVDTDGQIQYFNTTAADLLGDLEENEPATDALPMAVPEGETETEFEMDGRVFRLRSTELTDTRDRPIAYVLYLNEVTSLIEREQRISVLNRVLRHNIRNDLNVVTSHLELLDHADDSDQNIEEHTQTALAKTRRVIDFAEKARHIERTLQKENSSVPVSVVPVTDRLVGEIRDTYSDADIEVSVPDEELPQAHVVDPDLLEMSIHELIENAIVHNDQPTPRVQLSFSVDEGTVSLTVDDNGPAIPEQEQKVLDAQPETTLEHGSGLGLWLVYWTASLSSGDLSFGEQGSTVTLTLPTTEMQSS